MKAIFGVVATIALIATTNAYVLEYSEENVYVFSTADPEAEVSTADLFNADTEMKFKVNEAPMEEVNLIPDQCPDSAQFTETNCGSALGIHITNIGKTFCNLTNFFMSVDSFQEDYSDGEDAKDVEEQVVQFSLYFANGQEQPLLLETPVFKYPTEYASADEKKLEQWSSDNQVGILSPVDVQKLEVLSKTGEWQGDFKWLSEVVSYGIVESDGSYQITETDTEVLAFTTRPMVMHDGVVEKLIHVVDEYKKKYRD